MAYRDGLLAKNCGTPAPTAAYRVVLLMAAIPLAFVSPWISYGLYAAVACI